MDYESNRYALTRIDVLLSAEEMAALEGWRKANSVSSTSDAVRELIRMGLLSEIGRIYRAVIRYRAMNDDLDTDGSSSAAE